jgi:hypothetical protein
MSMARPTPFLLALASGCLTWSAVGAQPIPTTPLIGAAQQRNPNCRVPLAADSTQTGVVRGASEQITIAVADMSDCGAAIILPRERVMLRAGRRAVQRLSTSICAPLGRL